MLPVEMGAKLRANDKHQAIAQWRFTQIEEALGKHISRHRRATMARHASRTSVRWPSGEYKPIPPSTFYRWVTAARQGGIAALKPRLRSDRGKVHKPLPDEVITRALALLEDDPEQPMTFLLAVLEAEFVPPLVAVPRSTLRRRLSDHPSYGRIQRLPTRKRRRTRFVAKRPHHIWQCDAKGPVQVRFTSGQTRTFHVLTILADATRSVLAAIIVKSPDLGAAVSVFRRAAHRWGLPDLFYADRASIFDAIAFRAALADIGVHRIQTRARNAEAHGKIEAYHRVLISWFLDRLTKQEVVDFDHLQHLLDGIIAKLYQPHRHRSIQMAPEEALAGMVSLRNVPPSRLVEIFRQRHRLKAHSKTGEVVIGQKTYLVPDELRGKRLTFLIDPPGEIQPLVLDPITGKTKTVRPAQIKPDDNLEKVPVPSRGEGPLQTIYDHWQGKKRPQAEPGFGLPEIYKLLEFASGRPVPQTDAEAALIGLIYRAIGPLGRAQTEAAIRQIASVLGTGRPIKTYLDALEHRVNTTANNKEE